jgi:HSP20 family protein
MTMALIRWTPANELFNIHSELDRVFGDMMRDISASSVAGNGGQTILPVDVRRDGDKLVIEASVPGFKPEAVNVTVDNGVLTIDAQHQEESEKTEQDFIRRERYQGRYFRQLTLGEKVDGDKAKAEFKDGILTVTVPLISKPEPKRIPVSTTR